MPVTKQLLPILIGHGRDLPAIDEEGRGGDDTGIMAALSRGDARFGQRLVGQTLANLCLVQPADPAEPTDPVRPADEESRLVRMITVSQHLSAKLPGVALPPVFRQDRGYGGS